MQLTFTKTSDRKYKTIAIRQDKVVIQVPSFDHPTWLPHDIAHYIVELNLKLYDEFWGRVAEGALYPGMIVLEGRQPPHASARSKQIIKKLSQTDIDTETLVAILVKLAQNGLETDWAITQSLLRMVWKSTHAARPAFQTEEIRYVCRLLREMKQQWDELEVGQSITVMWPRATSPGHKGKPRVRL